MKLSKLNDHTALLDLKIKEQEPLLISLDQKIKRKQKDINALGKKLKIVDGKLKEKDLEYENIISQNDKAKWRRIGNYVVFFLLVSFLTVWLGAAERWIVLVLTALSPFIHWFYKERVKDNRLDEIEDQEEPLAEKRDDINEKIYTLTEELNELQEEYNALSGVLESLDTKKEIIKSVIPLNEIYDADNNNKLDIAETSNIELIIKQKQTSIREIEHQENRNYLKDFSKINIFLDSFKKQIIDDYKDIQDFCKIENNVTLTAAQLKIETFERDITLYKALMSSLVLMISNLVNDDLISFYKLYEIFDKLSVFESNYEKKVIQGFKESANLTKQLIQATHDSRDAIENALTDIGYQVNDVKFELEWLGKNNINN